MIRSIFGSQRCTHNLRSVGIQPMGDHVVSETGRIGGKRLLITAEE